MRSMLMSKFDIEISYGDYIKRLIGKWMDRRSSDLARETVFGDVLSVATKAIEEEGLKAHHGVASIKTYLRKTTITRCVSYCRDYDPESDMRLAPDRFGRERDVARRKREQGYMGKGDTLHAFRSFGMDFKKDVKHPEVFLLYMKGTKRSEIAEATGLDTLQVKNRQEYTIQKLRENPLAILANTEYTQNPSRYYDQRRERPLIEVPLKSLPREIKGQAEKEDEHN